MALDVTVDPEELARLARQLLDSSKTTIEVLSANRSQLPIGPGQLGNETGLMNVGLSYRYYLDDAMTAIERLVVVLEETADGLLQTAAALQLTDLDSAGDLEGILV